MHAPLPIERSCDQFLDDFVGAELNECSSGYNMSLRPEVARKLLCTQKLREKHEDFDALIRVRKRPGPQTFTP
jgi:hypothetical protein